MNNTNKIQSKDAIQHYPITFDKELTGGCELVIDGNIGGGGFSKTYVGRLYDRIASNCSSDKMPYTEVVIKEFFMDNYCQRGKDGETVEPIKDIRIFTKFLGKFQNESTALQKLNHPHIVKICSKFAANNTAYYVMERIKGVNLRDFLYKKKACLQLEEAYAVLETTFEALDFIHKNKVLHLDIKPENIMLVLDGTYKTTLIDFGLCKTMNDESDYAVRSSSTSAGTRGYSPKELTIDIDPSNPLVIDTSTDVYSLGATLYFLLTGLDPNGWDKSAIEGLSYPKYADPRGKDILEKAMQIHQKDRTKTIQEFVELFQKAMAKPLPESFKPASFPQDLNKALTGAQLIRVMSNAFGMVAAEEVPTSQSEKSIPMGIKPNQNSVEGNPVTPGTPVYSSFEPAPENVTAKKNEPKKEDKPVETQVPNRSKEPSTPKKLLVYDSSDKTFKPVEREQPSKGSSKVEWKTFMQYAWVAIVVFGLLLGIKYWGQSLDSKDNAKETVKEVINPSKQELSPADELSNLFKAYYAGDYDKSEITKLFADKAYFKMTNGSIQIGTPDDPNHTIDKLISSNYLKSGEYRIVKITKDSNSGLINSITIKK